MNALETRPENHQIFVFKKIYEFESAKQQAEKKKINAFGLMAKLNPLKRPTEDNVLLKESMLRYEPFWYVASNRTLDYVCDVTYNIPVHNPHAQFLSIDSAQTENAEYPINRKHDKAKVELPIKEHCHRVIDFANYFDGLKRTTKANILENYIKKFQFDTVDAISYENTLQPLLTVDALTTIVRSALQSESVAATLIIRDIEQMTALHLYFRPVYAFEYVWSPLDKTGVIEVDGLTGEIVENGSWFRDTFENTFTRDNLIELSSEIAGSFVPGGGTALKVASKLMENNRPNPSSKNT